MFRILSSVVVLVALSLTGLLAGGCTSSTSGGPYGLTGNAAEQNQLEMLRYTDAKGHYRPDLVIQGVPGNPAY